MLSYEHQILTALADPTRNLFAQHGERCPMCSGAGKTLGRFTGIQGFQSRTSGLRCACGGSGLDIERLQRREMSGLISRMEDMDRRAVEQAQQIASLQRLAGMSPHARSPQMSRQSWMECIAWATADGTAVANTTTETILMPNVTIPGGYMQDGRRLVGYMMGKLSTTATPTMTWAVRFGGVSGTLLATSEAITMGSGVTTVNWSLEFRIQTRTNGSSGSLQCIGNLTVHTGATTTLSNVFGVSGYDAPAAVSSLDLTTDWALSVTGKWSAASASNTITAIDYELQSLN